VRLAFVPVTFVLKPPTSVKRSLFDNNYPSWENPTGRIREPPGRDPHARLVALEKGGVQKEYPSVRTTVALTAPPTG
jgi:hypothetical protein